MVSLCQYQYQYYQHISYFSSLIFNAKILFTPFSKPKVIIYCYLSVSNILKPFRCFLEQCTRLSAYSRQYKHPQYFPILTTDTSSSLLAPHHGPMPTYISTTTTYTSLFSPPLVAQTRTVLSALKAPEQSSALRPLTTQPLRGISMLTIDTIKHLL